MAFWIKNNEKVGQKWKVLNSIFYGGWVILFILRMIVRMRDKANNVTSDFQSALTWIALISVLSYFITNFIHWLKPKWFENKN